MVDMVVKMNWTYLFAIYSDGLNLMLFLSKTYSLEIRQIKKIDFYTTVIPCTGMQCIKSQVTWK